MLIISGWGGTKAERRRMQKLRRALAAGQFPESMQSRIVGAEMLGVIMIDVSGRCRELGPGRREDLRVVK